MSNQPVSPKTGSKAMRDGIRIAIFVALGALLYLIDSTNSVVLQSFVIGMFMVMGSHLTRRLLFSHIDLQAVASKACETPGGAAVVFATVCVFLIAVMYVGMMVLK